jgi:cyclophilin family peptidyl-prolyl cis-trans isomerase
MIEAVFGSLYLALAMTTISTEPSKILVKMETNMGTIVLELNPDKAPNTVENFMRYVEDNFYDGTIFHRVIDGFMIQGGGFTADYGQKPTRESVKNEANNGLKNEVGTIAMARTNAPHSATAQFFINVENNSFLNYTASTPKGWGYAVFGKVVEGMDVVEKIKKIPTGYGGPFPTDVPQTTVVIEKMSKVVE